MHCPICQQEMTLWKEELARNKKREGAAYLRRRYRCEKDDVWGRLEVPTGTVSTPDPQRTPVAAQ